MPNVKTGKRRTKWSFFILFKLEKDNTQIVFVSYLKKRRKKRELKEKRFSSQKKEVLERDYLTSLLNIARSDRRQSSGQEGNLLYAERATHGHRI